MRWKIAPRGPSEEEEEEEEARLSEFCCVVLRLGGCREGGGSGAGPATDTDSRRDPDGSYGNGGQKVLTTELYY